MNEIPQIPTSNRGVSSLESGTLTTRPPRPIYHEGYEYSTKYVIIEELNNYKLSPRNIDLDIVIIFA